MEAHNGSPAKDVAKENPDKELEIGSNNEQSRENSPAPGKDSKSGSRSRRKPAKVHKVIEDDLDADPYMTMDIDIDSFLVNDEEKGDDPEAMDVGGAIQILNESSGGPEPSTSKAPVPSVKSNGDESIDIDEKGNIILPEGTVVVEPEDADSVPAGFKGGSRAESDDQVIVCTACRKQINTNSINNTKKHPVLQVLICKRCYKWYMSDEIEQDSDGLDNQCRWCGEGGDLICCDYCSNAFCKDCIRRNLGQHYLSQILEADEKQKWHCFVCDPQPLTPLITECNKIIAEVEKVCNEKERVRQESLKNTKPVTGAPKPVTAKKSTTQSGKHHQTARKSTTPQPPRAAPPPQSRSRTAPASTKGAAVAMVQPSRIGIAEQIAKQAVQNMAMMRARSQVRAPPPKPTPKPTPKVTTPKPRQTLQPVADIPINEFNVTPVLDRMFAAAQSMHMLLNSLKLELKHAARKAEDINQLQSAKQLVALKLKRAFAAYQKSFADIDAFARNFQPIRKPQHSTKRVIGQIARAGPSGKPTAEFLAKHGTKLKPNELRMVAGGTGLNHLMPAAKSQPSEVIELSDSEEEVEERGKNGKGTSLKSKKRKVSEEEMKEKKKSKPDEKEEEKGEAKAEKKEEKEDEKKDDEAEEEKKSEKSENSEKEEEEEEEVKDKKEDEEEGENGDENAEEGEKGEEKEEKDQEASEDQNEESKEEKQVEKEENSSKEKDETPIESKNSDLNGNDEDISEGDDELNPKFVGFKALGPMEFDASDVSQVDGMDDPKDDVPPAMAEELRVFEESLRQAFTYENEDNPKEDEKVSSEASDSDADLSFEKVEAEFKKKKKHEGKEGEEEEEQEEPVPSTSAKLPVPGRSREDIEAQRILLKKCIDMEGPEDDDDEEEEEEEEVEEMVEVSDDSEDNTSVKSDDSDYDPSSTKRNTSRRKSPRGEDSGDHDKSSRGRPKKSGHEKKEKKRIKKEEKEADKKESRKLKKLKKDSDSEDDFEQEVKNLAKLPKLRVNLKKLEVEGLEKAEKKDKKSEKKEKKEKKKKDEKPEFDLGLSSSSDDSDEDEVEKPENGDVSLPDEPIEEIEEDENEKARKALLARANNASDSEAESTSDSDFESEQKKPQKVKKTKEKKTAEKKSENEESDAEEIAKSRKKRFRDKLLTEKLSEDDDDSDVVVAKKTSRKRKQDEEEWNDSSDESDINTKSKKKRRKKSESDDDDDDDDDDDEIGEEEEEEEEEEESKKKGKKNGKKGKNSKSKKSKRKRVKMATDSSEDSSEEKDGSDKEDDEEDVDGKKRKKIRKILKDKKLSVSTLSAAKAEEERRKRIEERQKIYNEMTETDMDSPTKCKITTKLVLEFDENKEPILEVNPKLIRKLKPHQVEAVKFLWNSCVEDLERLRTEEGSGCILAHCMGLGKTLSVISFISTLMFNEELTKIRTCLVVTPLNTVLNWQAEFAKWLGEDAMDVYEMSSVKNNWGRMDLLQSWQEGGGIMIIGYELYRILTQHQRVKNKKQKKAFTETLADPGPDIVVCDEGHILKNDASGMSKAMNQIKTKRRIILTGTPLQNNLAEYHCMVSFVKPGLLGTRKEFCNRFVNPITNGQCSDSTSRDVKVMKRRAHILHDLLAGCVQRRDYSALTKFLPPKNEYVISVRLSKVQMELYERYLNTFTNRGMDSGPGCNKGARLFSDYQNLMKIWTHPWVLRMDEIRQETKRWNKEDDMESFLDDSEAETDASFLADSSEEDTKKKKSSKISEDEDDDLSLSEAEEVGPRRTRGTRRNDKDEKADENGADKTEKEKKNFAGEVVKKWKTRSRTKDGTYESSEEEEEDKADQPLSTEWWGDLLTKEDHYNLELGGKLSLLAEVLKMAGAIGDKVLVFSQSLLSLNLIEDFLEHWDTSAEKLEEDEADEGEGVHLSGNHTWIHGADYFRMDGSTSAQLRQSWAEQFNQPSNDRARLFLISTKAGSLGINLVAANRVIVFDASWNPTHDVQSIFRVYRFGQKKPTYVYRFLAQGTMEEKIYERQVTKLSLSSRVIDEHQIERHFSSSDLAELYLFKPDRLDDPERIEEIPALPKDRLLAELLTSKKEWLVRYLEHDSLLENQVDQELTEEERKAAWEEYENEKKGIVPQGARGAGGMDHAMMLRQMMLMQQQQQMQQQMPNYMSLMQQQHQALSLDNIMPDAQQVAQQIFARNPTMGTDELERRVQVYIQERMYIAKQQEARRLEALRSQQRPVPAGGASNSAQYSQMLSSMLQSGGMTAAAVQAMGQRMIPHSASAPNLEEKAAKK